MTLVSNWHNKLTASDDADDGRRKHLSGKWSGGFGAFGPALGTTKEKVSSREFEAVKAPQMPNNQLNVKATGQGLFLPLFFDI